MVLLDLFSGIGGFHRGLHNAGFNFKKIYFAEIDKYAVGTYKYNFQNQNIEHIGDVRDTISTVRETPDIITFGSPCQDFSIAGKRAGLEGKRSSLLLTALDIVRTFRPAIFIWENVKGTFSSNGGRDFIEVLRTIADIGFYECEWQLVNTKWLLPQNRERIYLIGHLAEKRGDFRKVFPIRENDSKFCIKDRQQKCIQTKVYADTVKSGYYKIPADAQYIADYRQDEGLRIREDNLSPTLQARAREDKYGVPMVKNQNSIRRLTPIECERLQGYTDNYTKYRIDEKNNVIENSDSQRYKMIGNSVTVDIVKMICEKLLNI